MELSQQEANTLIAIEKYLTTPSKGKIPPLGKKQSFPIHDKNKEKYKTIMYRGNRNSKKVSYTLLYQGRIVLIRVDLNYNSPHQTTVDGELMPANTPHIHFYDEEHYDKIAHPLPSKFSHTDDIVQTLYDFLSYSNVINLNDLRIYVQGGLFDEESN